MINFTQLFTCNQTEIHQKSNNEKKYLSTTKLSVLIDPEGELLLIMGDICYGITRQTIAEYNLYENNFGSFMILSLENKLHGNYELLIKDNSDLLVACLTDKCTVVGKEKDVKKEQFLTPKAQQDPQIQQELQIGLPFSQSDGKYVQMSKNLGQGIYILGKYISKGLLTVGDYVAKNVEPSNEIKFSENTKHNLKRANQFTTKVFDMAAGAAKNLVNYGRQVALDAANQGEAAKIYQEPKKTYDFKKGAATGLKVFINLYDGMVEAGDEVKNGVFKAGGEVIKKKYGLEAQQALRHVAGGVDNVLKVYKLPKDSVKDLFLVDKQQKKNQTSFQLN